MLLLAWGRLLEPTPASRRPLPLRNLPQQSGMLRRLRKALLWGSTLLVSKRSLLSPSALLLCQRPPQCLLPPPLRLSPLPHLSRCSVSLRPSQRARRLPSPHPSRMFARLLTALGTRKRKTGRRVHSSGRLQLARKRPPTIVCSICSTTRHSPCMSSTTSTATVDLASS